jgi:hypothetical protein
VSSLIIGVRTRSTYPSCGYTVSGSSLRKNKRGRRADANACLGTPVPLLLAETAGFSAPLLVFAVDRTPSIIIFMFLQFSL